MRSRLSSRSRVRLTLPLLATLGALPAGLAAQDRLKTMPGYDQYQKVSGQIQGSVKLGTITPIWGDDGRAFEYQLDGKWFRFDLATRKATEITAPSPAAARQAAAGLGGRGGRGGGGQPARGRQFESALSPDSAHRAFYRDRNLWVSEASGGNETPITTDGSEKGRIKYGTASWVYGEELGQHTAMWWSPDGKKLAYYRFDESQVPDFYLALNQTKLQTTVDTEAYPKPGVPNPIVDLFVYDVANKRSTRIDVRDGKPFENPAVGHYVYHVEWSPGGSELTFYRTNRRQNILEYRLCSGLGTMPCHPSRGVAAELAGEQPHAPVPQGRQAVHLGVGAQRLQQLLPVRSRRNVAGDTNKRGI